MNVGIFTDTYYPEINGVANSAYQLKKELERRGHNVYVFTVTNPNMEEEEHNVFRMKSIPLAVLKDRRVGCSIFAAWYKVIQGLELDVIHTQTEFTVGHIGKKAAKKLGVPLIHTYHTIYEDYTHYLKVPGNTKFKGAIRSLSRMCCNHADTVIVPTSKVRNLLLRYGVKRRIAVQPTGIDLSKFDNVDEDKVKQLRAQYGLKDSDHVLISIGRLSKEKSLDTVVSMVDEIRQADSNNKLVIVGNGPEEDNLRKMVADRQLEDRVIFTGVVPWNEIQNYYAMGDVFVSASTSETQGLTYIEALAAGKPLLVRKDDCLDGVLDYGLNGYSFTNDEEFAEGYRRLFDDNNYESMKPAALKAADRVSATSFAAGVEKIYSAALKCSNTFAYGDIRVAAG